jgi:hypothetical protein
VRPKLQRYADGRGGTRACCQETSNRRALWRLDFYVPLLSSRHVLAVNQKTAITAYSGSIWVDQEGLDIIRLETRDEDIPSDIDCREAHESVTYGRVRLGVGDRLIPAAAELVLVHRDGRKTHNTIAFSRCHHYAAKASLSFNTVPTATEPARVSPEKHLPAGVGLQLRLEQPITIAESAAGDEIVARLDKAVRSGSILLPKGTPVLGRIRRLEQHFSPSPSYLIALEFFTAELPVGQITFSARLTGPVATPQTVVVRDFTGQTELRPGTDGLEIEEDGARTGVGRFRVRRKDIHIPRGFRTFWITQ